MNAMHSINPLPLDHGGELAKPVRSDHSTNTAASGSVQISSRALFLNAKVVEIEHNGALYRLSQTALGKLILTK